MKFDAFCEAIFPLTYQTGQQRRIFANGLVPISDTDATIPDDNHDNSSHLESQSPLCTGHGILALIASGGKVICDLCGQTYLTPADLDDHLRDMHQVIRKKLMFGSRGVQDVERNSPLTVQDQNGQAGEAIKPLGAHKSHDANAQTAKLVCKFECSCMKI